MDNWLYETNKDNTHRFVLGISGKNPLICIGVNPSTATPEELDRTMTVVSRIAKEDGFDGYIMLNLYSLRATNPDELDTHINAELNEYNMHWIDRVLSKGNLTIWAAWGTLIKKRTYLLENLELISEIAKKNSCKWVNKGKRTKEGHPHHPLYLANSAVAEDFDVEKYITDKKPANLMEIIEPYVANDRIYFKSEYANKLGYTNYEEELWQQIKHRKWHPTKNSKGQYKYIQSQDRSLHQVVIDFYFGEEVRLEAYKNKYIIEHLDNDGFNCEISNLYFLLDVRNTYKGWYFDKKVVESLPIVAMSIFHIIDNHTFQISIGFNAAFVNGQTGKYIQNLKLLYNCDYWTVLQDAERMLDEIVMNSSFGLASFKKMYRFNDYKITYCPELELTEEEKSLPSGSAILRDGEVYILNKGEFEKFHILKPYYEKEWNV